MQPTKHFDRYQFLKEPIINTYPTTTEGWLHKLDMEKTAAWQQGYAQGKFRSETTKKLTFEEWWNEKVFTGNTRGREMVRSGKDKEFIRMIWNAAQENK